MITKCVCNNCPGHIEFEVARAGKTVACPHCGMETVLYITKGGILENAKSLELPTATMVGNKSRLTVCPDCSREVSIRAEVCPGCGAPLRATQPDTSAPALGHLSNVHNKAVVNEIQTARSGRKLIVIGSVMMICSVGGCASGTEVGAGIGTLLFLGGMTVFVIGRLHQN